MVTRAIAEIGSTPRFVMRRPPLDTVAQALRNHLRVVGEGMGRIAHQPAALLL